jgi:acetate kinase
MTAAMAGLDAMVFTGGAGEASARLRADVCTGLGFLGVRLDETANAAPRGDRLVSPLGATTAVLVVHAREDLEIARQVRVLLG